ncbi:MAG TPA: NUDIX hydrolase [Acidobacteriaceae bacterium]|nr:NUDIX hydrolase [Acidobacteriaceae bacterium]
MQSEIDVPINEEMSTGEATERMEGASLPETKGKRGAHVALVSSKLAYSGPLFDVYTDYVREPEGEESRRDVIRHSGSVVILALDSSKNSADPMVVVERQYRHAAGQYMWELPAGRKEPEEAPLAGAKRELLEETGYTARRWSKLARFYVSPGFLAEWMQVYVAEGLTSGQTKPDEDEHIECRQIPLSRTLQWIETGKIIDAKTIVALLLYSRRRLAVRRSVAGS